MGYISYLVSFWALCNHLLIHSFPNIHPGLRGLRTLAFIQPSCGELSDFFFHLLIIFPFFLSGEEPIWSIQASNKIFRYFLIIHLIHFLITQGFCQEEEVKFNLKKKKKQKQKKTSSQSDAEASGKALLQNHNTQSISCQIFEDKQHFDRLNPTGKYCTAVIEFSF